LCSQRSQLPASHQLSTPPLAVVLGTGARSQLQCRCLVPRGYRVDAQLPTTTRASANSHYLPSVVGIRSIDIAIALIGVPTLSCFLLAAATTRYRKSESPAGSRDIVLLVAVPASPTPMLRCSSDLHRSFILARAAANLPRCECLDYVSCDAVLCVQYISGNHDRNQIPCKLPHRSETYTPTSTHNIPSPHKTRTYHHHIFALIYVFYFFQGMTHIGCRANTHANDYQSAKHAYIWTGSEFLRGGVRGTSRVPAQTKYTWVSQVIMTKLPRRLQSPNEVATPYITACTRTQREKY